MITSESSNTEFHRFFNEHREELIKRLLGLLLNKHRRTILSLLHLYKKCVIMEIVYDRQ